MSFDSDIKRFSKQTGVALDKAVRKIAFDAFSMVTKKTPVDTGRAKGNWNFSVNSINESVDDEANSTGQGRPAKSPDIQKGDGLKQIYITNSLDYIHDLENGTSKKAPNGMVAITVNEIRASLS
jgi:hypothetical protein